MNNQEVVSQPFISKFYSFKSLENEHIVFAFYFVRWFFTLFVNYLLKFMSFFKFFVHKMSCLVYILLLWCWLRYLLIGDLSKMWDLLEWNISSLINFAYFCKALEVDIFYLKLWIKSRLFTLIYFKVRILFSSGVLDLKDKSWAKCSAAFWRD